MKPFRGMLLLAFGAAVLLGFRHNAGATVLVLAVLAACFLATRAVQRHGVAGCLYLAAGLLKALGDAWMSAERAFGESWSYQRRNAIEEAAR